MSETASLSQPSCPTLPRVGGRQFDALARFQAEAGDLFVLDLGLIGRGLPAADGVAWLTHAGESMSERQLRER